MQRLRPYSKQITLTALLLTALLPINTSAMHIMEGYLPPLWCIVWYVVATPFVVVGAVKLIKLAKTDPKIRMLIALIAAFAFVLSALKIPSVTGSCSHPTGTSLGAVIFGPWVMAVVSVVVLLFQAIMLAHGGITTLGANTFSMGIVGPFVAFFIYWLVGKKLKGNIDFAVFLAAFFGSLCTYVITSLQLAISFPDSVTGILGSFIEFASVFALTQAPLSIIEGLLTMLVFRYLRSYSINELVKLNVIETQTPAGPSKTAVKEA